MYSGRNKVKIGPSWFSQREIGLLNPVGSVNRRFEYLYSSTKPIFTYDGPLTKHGGIFSLEYSPLGSYMVAACEKRCLLIFDPLNPSRQQLAIDNAHADCVNCVRFIDQNLFATCSDDTTVALWDVRKLDNKLRSLEGHLNWVKSIEYASNEKLLLTSGFDGRVLTWDIYGLDQSSNSYERVFVMNGLMRTRLSPDGSKMVVCTTAGYIIVIHNLNLRTLAQDLGNFKPNLYRLMQMSQTELPAASEFTELFRGAGKRNRVEFVTDFPGGDDAEVVSSLQVHPHGHSIVSRNITTDENSEWSCVHNVEERLSSDESDINDEATGNGDLDSDTEFNSYLWNRTARSTAATMVITRGLIRRMNEHEEEHERLDAGMRDETDDLRMSPADVWEAVVAIQEARQRREQEAIVEQLRRQPRENQSRQDPGEGSSSENGADNLATAYEPNETERLQQRRGVRMSSGEGHSTLMRRRLSFAMARRIGREGEMEEERPQRRSNRRVIGLGMYRAGGGGNSVTRHQVATMSVTSDDGNRGDEEGGENGSENSERRGVKRKRFRSRKINKNIHQNIKRLTHYVEEPNVGRGFIKELCFSPDGRVLCSPFGNGFRLLSFSPDVLDLRHCYPKNPPLPLYELMGAYEHSDVVVSTKFSPTHYLLTSGCLSGKICFYQPYIG